MRRSDLRALALLATVACAPAPAEQVVFLSADPSESERAARAFDQAALARGLDWVAVAGAPPEVVAEAAWVVVIGPRPPALPVPVDLWEGELTARATLLAEALAGALSTPAR